jgi:hypothetical protein
MNVTMISAKCNPVPIHHNHPTTATTDDIDLTLLFSDPITAASFQLGAWGTSSLPSTLSSPLCSPPQEIMGLAKPQPPITWYHTSDDDDSQSYDWSIEDVDGDTVTKTDNDHVVEEILLDKSFSQSMSMSVHSSTTTIVACRVRFCGNIRVRHYEKSDPEDWVHLYYSAHELQRMMDSYVKEEEIRLQMC